MQSNWMDRADHLQALGDQVPAPMAIDPVKPETRPGLSADVQRMENPIVALPALPADAGRPRGTDHVDFVESG